MKARYIISALCASAFALSACTNLDEHLYDKLTIEVLADIDGKTSVMGSHVYRVKNLPKPNAYFEVGGQVTEDTKIARKALMNPANKIVASYGADGLIQARFTITGFQVKLPTGASFSIKGDKLDGKAIDAIGKLKQGNMVNIMYIKAVGLYEKSIFGCVPVIGALGCECAALCQSFL